jgi:hypothetical protein
VNCPDDHFPREKELHSSDISMFCGIWRFTRVSSSFQAQCLVSEQLDLRFVGSVCVLVSEKFFFLCQLCVFGSEICDHFVF